MGKKVLILANSRKKSGRCIAGKDALGNWIRLTKNNHAPIPVSEGELYCINKVLEVDGIVNIPSSNYKYHTENSVYSKANVLGYLDRAQLEDFLDDPEDIFGSGKCISEDNVQKLRESLLFIKVKDLTIYFKDCGEYGNKLRGQFIYNGKVYSDIAVTDSITEERFKNNLSTHKEMYTQAYITISLGEIFMGSAYKLISGIILN